MNSTEKLYISAFTIKAIALSENPPQEIAQELKDLFIKINLRPYFERHGLSFDEEKLSTLMGDKQGA